MTEAMGYILQFLGMIFTFFFGLVIWPEQGLTIGELFFGVIVTIMMLFVGLALGGRISGFGGGGK